MAAFEPESAKAVNKVKRLPDRGRYDEETIHSILDAQAVAHVTFKLPPEDVPQLEDEFPVIIPMIYGRKDNNVYLHGHMSSRLLKTLSNESQDVRACVAVTIVDGMVVSFAPFHNSNNYRSAVLFGVPSLVTDDKEKVEALTLITDHGFIAKDGSKGPRWDDSRPTHDSELKQTRVIKIPIESASAKVRTGGPNDEEVDKQYSKKYWTGHIVKKEVFTEAIPSPYNQAPVPAYIQNMLV